MGKRTYGFIFVVIFSGGSLWAQTTPQEAPVNERPDHIAFLELGGSAGFYQVGYNYFLNQNFTVGLGGSVIPESGPISQIRASYLTGNTHNFEVQLGGSLLFKSREAMPSPFIGLGYVYLPKNSGIFLRASAYGIGMTMKIVTNKIQESFVVLPWLGLSAGYGF